jgi:excisionase family DNA binding protein
MRGLPVAAASGGGGGVSELRSEARERPRNRVLLELPSDGLEAVAKRAAEIVIEQLETHAGDAWPGWMGVETAARYLDVSPERVRKLIARREIPFAQEAAGCRVFLRREWLDSWLMAMAQTPR